MEAKKQKAQMIPSLFISSWFGLINHGRHGGNQFSTQLID